jgi:hypothetical protein
MILPSLATIEEYDQRIALLEGQLLDLRRRRNAAFVPACQVPAELLAQVFAHVQHGGTEYDETQPWKSYRSEWARVMLVCQHFRDVAVRTPALWSTLDYRHSSRKWNDLCETRSANVPVYINDPVGESANVFPRARAAHLQLELLPAYAQFLASSAPNLKFLKLSGSFRYLKLNVTASILGGQSLSLVQLTLSGMFLIDMPFMPHLRRLELRQIRLSAESTSPFISLKNAPTLESLSVQHTTSQGVFSADYISALNPISLPHLLVLEVEDNPEMAALCLRCLPLPKSMLKLECFDCFPEDMDDDLNQEHMNIYQTWKLFMQRVHQCNSPPKGDLYSHRGSAFGVTFGPSLELERLNIQATGSCTFVCDEIHSHPIFDDVETVLFHNDDFPLWHIIDLDVLVGVRVLRFQAMDAEDIGPEQMVSLKDWIMHHKERIREVVFEQCHDNFRALATQLQQEGVVPNVAWLT